MLYVWILHKHMYTHFWAATAEGLKRWAIAKPHCSAAVMIIVAVPAIAGLTVDVYFVKAGGHCTCHGRRCTYATAMDASNCVFAGLPFQAGCRSHRRDECCRAAARTPSPSGRHAVRCMHARAVSPPLAQEMADLRAYGRRRRDGCRRRRRSSAAGGSQWLAAKRGSTPRGCCLPTCCACHDCLPPDKTPLGCMSLLPCKEINI
jgi:hypothetical protein